MYKCKPIKRSNKNLIKFLFECIEKETNFHIVEKEFGDTYFVFQGEKDSICHFHIKEIPGFLFGIWTVDRYNSFKDGIPKDEVGKTFADSLEINPLSEVIFFTQYEEEMDKFKPSRSGFVLGLWRTCYMQGMDDGTEGVQLVEEWDGMYDLENVLNFMKNHKYKAYVYAGIQARYVWDIDVSGFYCFKTYMKERLYYKISKFKKERHYKKVLKKVLNTLKDIETFDYYLEHYNSVYPPLHLHFRSKNNCFKDIVTEKRHYQEYGILSNLEEDVWKDLSVMWWEDLDNTENDKELELKFKNRLNIPDSEVRRIKIQI